MVEGRVFATEPVSETYPIVGRRKDHISPSVSALGFFFIRKTLLHGEKPYLFDV
ncbi:hypothetical protein PGTDC60_2211 [Porphyromonas gingivalis TDC60]|nr:hypothetical protein PGTDC60_0380 [Porphyromonas gingivalis TDC60]BAK25390.1 hypothetical protein PGTDC60_1235 [Porphyromonas gingivalis TDC60]BAK26348.1 hypothetical protein PGTDC60_2211 [Porphyromonas gingivalis TDC60]